MIFDRVMPYPRSAMFVKGEGLALFGGCESVVKRFLRCW
jgi:hypothetical protein